ncbi:hypothetical protein [Clostridium cellulovorans]|uniref:Uncharacterized protein n=1 Tax=Clostridium cellulovorans (strain ATCC 35296 / DSM 3052 / OCM 3 / 743B) TaxID=573061 RepID=D9SRP5_CLOC7|nr:hypothetical protein [Clostridium cellulovorans]ADL50412.1 hypothetical protein Clocel_0641 [Clostridium cellulovorans 743B]
MLKSKKNIIARLRRKIVNLPISKFPYYRLYRPTYALTLPEVNRLKGRRIRTTVPNIVGTITATVGEYNPNTNRVELKNIISDRTGVSYGNLSYLLDEIAGLQVLPKDNGTPGGSKDCQITGGKGKYITSGETSIGNVSVKYTIHECMIEIIPRVDGLPPRRLIINRNNTRVQTMFRTSPRNRIKFTAWIQNNTVWVEIEYQRRTRFGRWQRINEVRTKLGTWQDLKI